MNQSLPSFQLVGAGREMDSHDRVIWRRSFELRSGFTTWEFRLRPPSTKFKVPGSTLFPIDERDDVPVQAGHKHGQRRNRPNPGESEAVCNTPAWPAIQLLQPQRTLSDFLVAPCSKAFREAPAPVAASPSSERLRLDESDSERVHERLPRPSPCCMGR